jgi:hypothetical protein
MKTQAIPTVSGKTARDLAYAVNRSIEFDKSVPVDENHFITAKIWESQKAIDGVMSHRVFVEFQRLDTTLRSCSVFSIRDLYLTKIKDLDTLECILSEYF